MIRFVGKRYYIYLILLLALVLRLISINQSLWLDEATTALVAQMSLTDIFTKFLPADFHPPFYYLLMKGWGGVFGFSEVSLRIPSIIFGVATIYFIYLIAKKIFDIKTAWTASLISATSGLLIYYSQEARMYSLTAFLATVSVYLFLEKKWFLFSIAIALLAMTDYLALLILPVFLIFAGKDIKKLLASLVLVVAVFIFWSPIFLTQLANGLSTEGGNWWNILGTLSWKNLGLIPVKFILGRISFDNKTVYALTALASFSAFGVILGRNILRRPLKGNPCKVIWGWLVIPIVLGILISIKLPVLYYFRFLFCLPALYILLAGSISRFSGVWKFVAISAVLTINLFSSGYYLLNPKFHRENWKGLAAVVGEVPIIYPANSQKEALTYYEKSGQIIYYKNFDGKFSEIWLSRYVWGIFDPNDLARIKVEELGYNKVQELNMNGVVFWKYSKQGAI